VTLLGSKVPDPVPYPRPSDIGGTLIRQVIATFKSRQFTIPFDVPIAIACSGGMDSMCLAHLIGRYGRNIIDPARVTLLYFDHGWRPESATTELEQVQKWAKELSFGFESVKLQTQTQSSQSDNLEEDARLKRNHIYRDRAGPEAAKKYRYIWTAHHQDDVIETLVWRFFRGEIFHQSQGILFCDDPVLRPFLQVTKDQIKLYSRSEAIDYLDDPTNHDTTRMRAKLRHQVFPLIEQAFPGFKSSVAKYAHPAE
jgi:tRNA(Ile)-lysidine synthase